MLETPRCLEKLTEMMECDGTNGAYWPIVGDNLSHHGYPDAWPRAVDVVVDPGGVWAHAA